MRVRSEPRARCGTSTAVSMSFCCSPAPYPRGRSGRSTPRVAHHCDRIERFARHTTTSPVIFRKGDDMLPRLTLLLSALGLLTLGGCSGPSMAPVKGQVMYNGKPVKAAAVPFSPTGPPGQLETGKPATGFTD